ncbi:MAG: hypothetical protein IPH24_08240 [Crocinitomicaceae bacterium]|nr:hypothetical protein [Crocinitomicaceae bacterium]
MSRLSGLILLAVIFITFSCEKCMSCSYTYTVTTIEQTVNGEKEVVTTYTGYVKINDSTYFDEECIKGDESFTIESQYILFANTTTLDDFAYTCTGP